MTALSWAWLDTPVGQVSVGCSAAGVARVRFGQPPAEIDSSRDNSNGPGNSNGPDSAELARAAREQLTEYFSGQRKDFDVPIDWSGTAGTQRQVLEVLQESVGYGQTVTYGNLAVRAGLPASGDALPARAVGSIMGSNPIPIIVPCHRVLASDGLGGYSGAGIEVKRWLLILEGVLPPTLDWQLGDPAA